MRQLPDRAIVGVAGPDAAEFLQGLVTQAVAAGSDDRLAFGALLTPQGKVLFDFLFEARRGLFLIDCAAFAADALVKRLSLYRL